MAEIFAALEKEYCPPLDPALLSAILYDYDLSTERGVQDARATLEPLKEFALLEEEAGFDPSGTGAAKDDTVLDHQATSRAGTAESESHETDLTSLSHKLSSLDTSTDSEPWIEKSAPLEENTDLDQLDEEEKIQALQEVFEDQVNAYTIKHTLRKCQGRFHATIEELLNHVFFGEDSTEAGAERVNYKSVDAFSAENAVGRGRKNKARRKNSRRMQERALGSLGSDGAAASGSNKWQSATQDIEFIASRTGLASATVSSMYYAKGASVPQTIGAILKKSIDEKPGVNDSSIIEYAHELGLDFSTIRLDYRVALIRITQPSTTAAHELAKALTTRPAPSAPPGGIKLIPRYVLPIGTVDSEDDIELPITTNISGTNLDLRTAAAYRAALAAAKAEAYSKARTAHRKGKSDHHMGGAAAYYSELGREYAAQFSRATAQVADSVAAAQSDRFQLDLHGIDVLNAVRIAKEYVHAWWASMGESRTNGRLGAEERAIGYRIVVGLGKHSEGGKGKLGPAVSKALRADGWRVDVDGAKLHVNGPMRK